MSKMMQFIKDKWQEALLNMGVLSQTENIITGMVIILIIVWFTYHLKERAKDNNMKRIKELSKNKKLLNCEMGDLKANFKQEESILNKK